MLRAAFGRVATSILAGRPADSDNRVSGADSSVRTGLTGCAPHRHILRVSFERTRRRTTPPAWVPAPGNEPVPLRVMPQMLDEAGRVAAAVALGIAHLHTNFGASLAEPNELHWRELPRNPNMGRCVRDFVRRGRCQVACRADQRLRADPAGTCTDVHPMRAGLVLTSDRPHRNVI